MMEFIDSAGKLVEKDFFTNREPSLFAVAKLLETGLVNLNRVITTLVRSAIQYEYSTSLKANQRLQTLISPLNELSSTSLADVRQKSYQQFSRRKFSTLRVPVFTVGGKGLSPCFTMEMPAFSSRNDRKIWITNTRSQRFSHSNWSHGIISVILIIFLECLEE
ncbi:hypothetical protein OUZ56_012504 [Daphnia magna]|uniref:Uncharacterized protein n=1 Tax=Daphnia magna TaxID=35525 RepID=A0ABQ9Z3D0_9CRUS|nr:hypothetical protein OUZ56_012504 [Daphnia magna]